MVANAGETERSIDVIPQSSDFFDIDTFTTTGDIDLDGISSSISDLAAYYVFFVCIWDPGPPPPEILEMIAQSDINCDSIVLSVADLVILWQVILGEIEPCYGGMGAPADDRQPVLRRGSNSEAYAIEIANTELFVVDTGWVDIVITEGTESFCGFQFHLEYDTTGIELLDAQIGEGFSQWSTFLFHEDISGDTADLKLASFAMDLGASQMDLSLPPLPVTLARLKFSISAPDSGTAKDINFVWDYCGDNSLAVSLTNGVSCWGPEYLAVSRKVFDAENNNVTGTSELYGGAGDVCLLGGPFSQPVRFVDFTSGRLTYDPSCCQGITGNVDGIGEINVADLTYLVEFLFFDGPAPPCSEEGDVDSSGAINMADLTYLVDYLFFGGPAPPPCP